MIIVLYDNRVSYGTFTRPFVYVIKDMSLLEIHKVLMRVDFGSYRNFMSCHCLNPDTPARLLNGTFLGTFGDSEHLNFELSDNVTLTDVLSGKVATINACKYIEDSEDFVDTRLRFMSLQDYHNEIMAEHRKRLQEFEEVTSNPSKFYIQ